MRTFIIKPGDLIPIGRAGENQATQIRFDVTGWADTFGAGTYALVVKRPHEDTAYPVEVTVDGDYVVWTVSNVDTGIAGNASVQLRYVVSDAVAKSVIYRGIVGESLDHIVDPPDPYEDLIDRIEELVEEAVADLSDELRLTQATVYGEIFGMSGAITERVEEGTLLKNQIMANKICANVGYYYNAEEEKLRIYNIFGSFPPAGGSQSSFTLYNFDSPDAPYELTLENAPRVTPVSGATDVYKQRINASIPGSNIQDHFDVRICRVIYDANGNEVERHYSAQYRYTLSDGAVTRTRLITAPQDPTLIMDIGLRVCTNSVPQTFIWANRDNTNASLRPLVSTDQEAGYRFIVPDSMFTNEYGLALTAVGGDWVEYFGAQFFPAEQVDIPVVDNTLSVPGAAADAKATGDAIAAVSSSVASDVASWLNDHVDPETGYVLDNSLSVANAASDSKAVGDMLEIGGRVTGIVQGARNASGSIATNAKRCTTSDTFQLVAGDVIQISNLDSGLKAAIAGVSGGSFIHDSGWLTQSDIYFVVGTAGLYFVNFAKVVDGNLSPSDIVTAKVTFKDHSYFNRLEAIPTIESEIDSVSETAGIAKDVSILAIFDDGYYVNGNTGVRNGRSEQSASRYIEIPTGFDTIEISMLVQKSEYPQGVAFYTGNQDSSFISGVVFPYDTSLAQLSQEIGIIPIPRTAKYFRTSWVATTYPTYSNFTFSCKLIKTGKFARVDGFSTATEAFTVDGFVNITKADMESGTLDNNGFLPNPARCRTANRYIKARKGDIVVGHRKTADILMAVVDDAVGSNILYSSGWRTADFALKTPNDGYYALIGKTSLDDFDGEFTIYSAKQQYKGLPDSYYQDEVDATLTAITDAQSEPCLCFPLVTDIHYGAWETTDNPYLFHKTFRNILKIAQEKKCDAVVNLGDIMDGNFASRQTAIDFAMRVNDMLMSLSVPYLITLGNHDDNHYAQSQKFSSSDLYKANLAYTGGKPYYNAETGGRDYYVDFDNLKIRLVCLNSFNYTNSSYAYASETVSWFTNIALDTPDGYLVVVLTHISPISSQNYNNTSVTNGTAIAQAIENYISGGKPAIQFYGHSHCDVAFTSPYLSISTCCNKFEDENGDPTKWPTGATMPERTEKTASEDLWDFVVIKPASRTVDLIRFGAGSDRTFTY